MAAASAERLFSLELLVDWVRLDAGPPPPPAVAGEAGEEEEAEEASPPPPSRVLCPAVALRLLDFPTLLVYPPGGPAAPAPEPRPGLVSFGRGKSCLFRLRPATLRRRLLASPLHALLLQLPPGRPTPAPQLLGSCSVPLAAAARRVLGPAASGCSQGHRGTFSLHNQVGQRIGDIGPVRSPFFRRAQNSSPPGLPSALRSATGSSPVPRLRVRCSPRTRRP